MQCSEETSSPSSFTWEEAPEPTMIGSLVVNSRTLVLPSGSLMVRLIEGLFSAMGVLVEDRRQRVWRCFRRQGDFVKAGS